MIATHHTEHGDALAYAKLEGITPGILFLGGFRSDMTGEKAMFLEALCRTQGRAFLRFDYFAHGASPGDFAEGSIGRWAENAISMLDRLTEGAQVIVGSSMGGWLMLLAALARPERVRALVGIAAAPDFTEDLIWAKMTGEQREILRRDAVFHAPSAYGEPYAIHRHLIEEGRTQRLLHQDSLPIACPVRLLHGMQDADVPWQRSLLLGEKLESTDVQLRLLKKGDHRMSSPHALEQLKQTVESLLG